MLYLYNIPTLKSHVKHYVTLPKLVEGITENAESVHESAVQAFYFFYVSLKKKYYPVELLH